MSENLRRKPSLVIISDTAMWQKSGNVLAFEPVVREIEAIHSLFSEIKWLGCEYDSDTNSKNARTINETINLKYHFLKRVGGPSFTDKIVKLLQIPITIIKVNKLIRGADIIHTRGPSLPAFIAIILSFFYKKKKWWHKYAGNWIEPSPPFFYGLQRILLRRANHALVAVNGDWSNEPSHIINFENPCVFESEIIEGRRKFELKQYNEKLILCFVGNLEVNKGCLKIIKALNAMNNIDIFDKLLIVGDGNEKDEILSKHCKVPIEYLGTLSRTQLNQIYERAHIILLPSGSEGFPKVIAEAACYGTIPLTTNISCLNQYIKTGYNGYLFESSSVEEIIKGLEFISDRKPILKEISLEATAIASKFTYEYFFERVKSEIVND